MAGMTKRQVRTHGIAGYRAGCRCVTCTLADSDRKRRFRAFGSGAKSIVDGQPSKAAESNVKPLRSRTPQRQRRAASGAASGSQWAAVGDIEQAVIDECAMLPVAAERPALVMATRLMARIMDNPELQALHVKASRELEYNMSFLRPTRKPKHQRASVHLLTRRNTLHTKGIS
jgi:hypothetical protein